MATEDFRKWVLSNLTEQQAAGLTPGATTMVLAQQPFSAGPQLQPTFDKAFSTFSPRARSISPARLVRPRHDRRHQRLTERKGVKTAMITTAGFADVLEIGRGNRPCFFNLFDEKPKSFVPAELRREVAGRMNYRGEELVPVDLSPIPAIVADFRAAGVQAVAVCLLHAYANPAHERAVIDAVKREWPAACGSRLYSARVTSWAGELVPK